MDVVAMYIYWNKWDLKNVKIILPPAMIGILIGTGTFNFTSEAHKGSGEMVFLENRAPISRTATQIEDIKLIIEF